METESHGVSELEREGVRKVTSLARNSVPRDPDFEPVARVGNTERMRRPSRSYWQDAWHRLKSNRQAAGSLAILGFLASFAMAGPFVWRSDPAAQDLVRISEGPSLGRIALVLSESGGLPAVGDPPAALAAPPAGTLAVDSGATTEAVSLRWAPIAGTTSYAIYRAESPGQLGVPLTTVEAAGEVTGPATYIDGFNLESRSYWYTVMPRIGDAELPAQKLSVRVALPRTISLAAAQAIQSDARAGMAIRLPAHPLGTDSLGRDLLARMIQGARISLFIGLLAPLLSTLLGVLIGGMAGFVGGRSDRWLMAFSDFVLALPFLLFMILFKIALGGGPGQSGISAMMIALVLLSWVGPARLVRGQVLQLREAEFVQAARLLGASPASILARHVLPNALGVVLVSLTFAIPTAIFTEAFLSFIGMGVVPPVASWGSLCSDGIQTFLTHPHEFFFPAGAISLTVLAFNLLGDGLRDALDPRLRSVS